MGGHDQVRKHQLRFRLRSGAFAALQVGEFPLDTVRPDRAEQIELTLPRRLCAPVGQIDDDACSTPSIAACGSSTKLCMPSRASGSAGPAYGRRSSPAG
jgi:hypothetical protein